MSESRRVALRTYVPSTSHHMSEVAFKQTIPDMARLPERQQTKKFVFTFKNIGEQGPERRDQMVGSLMKKTVRLHGSARLRTTRAVISAISILSQEERISIMDSQARAIEVLGTKDAATSLLIFSKASKGLKGPARHTGLNLTRNIFDSLRPTKREKVLQVVPNNTLRQLKNMIATYARRDMERFLGIKKTGNREADTANELNHKVFNAAFELGYDTVDAPDIVDKLAGELGVTKEEVQSSIGRIREKGDLPTILKYLPGNDEVEKYVAEKFSKYARQRPKETMESA